MQKVIFPDNVLGNSLNAGAVLLPGEVNQLCQRSTVNRESGRHGRVCAGASNTPPLGENNDAEAQP